MLDQGSQDDQLPALVLGIGFMASAGVTSAEEPAVVSQAYECRHISRATYHPSSASSVPRSRMCILVPGGHLKAGTAAWASRRAVSEPDMLLNDNCYRRQKEAAGCSIALPTVLSGPLYMRRGARVRCCSILSLQPSPHFPLHAYPAFRPSKAESARGGIHSQPASLSPNLHPSHGTVLLWTNHIGCILTTANSAPRKRPRPGRSGCGRVFRARIGPRTARPV